MHLSQGHLRADIKRVCLSVCVRQMLCLPDSTAPDSNSLPLVQLQQNSYQGQTHVKHWDRQTDLGQISESVGTHCDVAKISLMSHHLLNERLQHTQTYTLVYHDGVSQNESVKYHHVSAIINITPPCLTDLVCSLALFQAVWFTDVPTTQLNLFLRRCQPRLKAATFHVELGYLFHTRAHHPQQWFQLFTRLHNIHHLRVSKLTWNTVTLSMFINFKRFQW